MKKGMFVVCGNSIEEIEADVKAMKLAIANGESSGCGSVAYAMGMGGMSDEDIMTAVGSMVGTPPTADDKCCGCCCEDDDDLDAVLDEYSDDEITEWVRSNFTPSEIYDTDELLNDIPMECVLEYVRDNL